MDLLKPLFFGIVAGITCRITHRYTCNLVVFSANIIQVNHAELEEVGLFKGIYITQAALNGTIPGEILNDMATRILVSYFVVDANHTGLNFHINSKKNLQSLIQRLAKAMGK